MPRLLRLHDGVSRYLKVQKNVRQIFELARAGDKVAQGVLREFLEYLTVGVVNVANILRPQVIVIGGGFRPPAI